MATVTATVTAPASPDHGHTTTIRPRLNLTTRTSRCITVTIKFYTARVPRFGPRAGEAVAVIRQRDRSDHDYLDIGHFPGIWQMLAWQLFWKHTPMLVDDQRGNCEWDCPSAAHRRSYARRTGAERGFATAKDPASNDISRGWCRLMGLAPLMLLITTLLVVRNQRILAAWDAGKKETSAAPPPAFRPEHGAGAARPSPRSRQDRPRPHRKRKPRETHDNHSTTPATAAAACPGTSHPAQKAARPTRTAHDTAAATAEPDCGPECQT